MNDTQIDTLDKVRPFLAGIGQIEFAIPLTADRYAFIQRSLIRFGYNPLSKSDKGTLLRYLAHVSGYSHI